ncbi:hypothetical protein [Streptomyces nodosus]|uniref:Uncharacterized protein n=1 Tax=Streptomyces nodosus TaxID=40318 RepID=A0A0B5DBR0_9ACTN|nr:hypothetical protein [Streptomyces nodosus]AJE41063.1 hypothetical protein SNOD_14170 [Streptomyces nodosus]MBB4792181.1 hypothetical protein [Streptomyces nodosus]QEV39604.1 hypothetical protein CP978_14495 [Streptomyces nodosus]
MGIKGKIALGAVVGVVVIGAVSTAGGGDGKDGRTDTADKGSAPSGQHSGPGSGDKGGAGAKDKEGKAPAFDGDGSYVVGKDIQPGTYKTTGNSDGCYWERAKDASGEFESILANDNVTGTSYVTVKASDKLFKTNDCKGWETVEGKPSGAPDTRKIGGDAGMLRVGVDIAPGTYKSAGNKDDGCYWERTKDALHSLESIAANDNVTGTAVVTVAAGDAYFKTTGCKDWTKSS